MKYENFERTQKKISYVTNDLEFILFNGANNLFNIKQLQTTLINILPLEKIKTDAYAGTLANSPLETEIKNGDIDKGLIAKYIQPASSLKIVVNIENSQRIKAALLIKKSLSEYGINSEIEEKNFAEYKLALQNKNFDIFIGGFAPEKSFDYEKLFGTNNILSYTNEILLKNLSQLKSATNSDEFDSAINELKNTLREDGKIIILGQKKELLLLNKELSHQELTFVRKYLSA